MSPALLLELVDTCERRELGFRAAAEGVGDPPLRRLLESYAEQRAAFARELRRELSRLGAVAAAGGRQETARATQTSGAVPTGDEAAIIAECARDEEAAIRAYREALESAGEVVERQYQQLREAYDHLRLLEESRASAA
jgi:uncharacterized protein (TIGR02284 family)